MTEDCTHCSKKFSSKKTLRRHVQQYSKAIRCTECDKGFTLNADLKRHISKRHQVGQIWLPCPVESCGHKATRRDNLSVHIKKFHGSATKPKSQLQSAASAVPMPGQESPTRTSNLVDDYLSPATLLEAARAGFISIIDEAIRRDRHLSAIGDDGSTLLHCAARAGRMNVVNVLLDAGCPLHTRNKRSETPLDVSILGRHREIIKVLVGKLDSTDRKVKERAVLVASGMGDLQTLEMLLADSDNININAIHDGTTALIRASGCGHVDVVTRLLEEPTINVNARKDDGYYYAICKDYSAFEYAAYEGHGQIARLLLERAELDLTFTAQDRRPCWGLRAIRIAIRRSHPSFAQLVIEDSRCKSMEYVCRSLGHDLIVRGYLQQCHAIVLDQSLGANNMSRAELMIAHYASIGDLEAIKQTLDNTGVQIKRVPFRDRWTALEYAARSGHSQIVQYLLDFAGNGTFDDSCQLRAIRAAASEDHADSAKVLLARSKGNQTLHSDLLHAALDSICMRSRRLPEASITIAKAFIEESNTDHALRVISLGKLFGHAVRADDARVVGFLLQDFESDPNTPLDSWGGSALHLASKQGCLMTIQRLLQDSRVNVGKRDQDGYTALWYALDRVAWGFISRQQMNAIVGLLLKHSAIDDLVSDKKLIKKAYRYQNAAVIEFLEQLGVSNPDLGDSVEHNQAAPRVGDTAQRRGILAQLPGPEAPSSDENEAWAEAGDEGMKDLDMDDEGMEYFDIEDFSMFGADSRPQE